MKKIIIFLLLAFVVFLLTSCNRLSPEERIWSDLSKLEEEYSNNPDLFIEKISELNPEFENLYAKNEDLCYDYSHIEGDIATVWCYFEDEEDVSFDDAYSSFDKIYQFFKKHFNP